MGDNKKLLKSLFYTSRVEFLILPVILILTGHVGATYSGSASIMTSLIALFGLVTIHLAVNILNEVSDYRTGIDEETDETLFSGGSGILLDNDDVNVNNIEYVAISLLLTSILVGVYFIVKVGLAVLPVFILGVVIAYTYTDYLTNYTLGEVGMSLGLGILPIIGTDIVQDGNLGIVPVFISVPIACVAFNLLLMNEFPDVEADRKGGRKNLIHRFGRVGATRMYLFVAALTYFSIFATYIFTDVGLVFLASFFSVILLYRPVRWSLNNPTDTPPIKTIRDNLIWNIVTTCLIALTLWLSLLG